MQLSQFFISPTFSQPLLFFSPLSSSKFIYSTHSLSLSLFPFYFSSPLLSLSLSLSLSQNILFYFFFGFFFFFLYFHWPYSSSWSSFLTRASGRETELWQSLVSLKAPRKKDKKKDQQESQYYKVSINFCFAFSSVMASRSVASWT